MSRAAAAGGPSDTRTRPSGWVFRTVVTLHLLAIVAQPLSAGAYLSGDAAALGWHDAGADIVTALGYAQLIVSIVVFRRLRARWVLPVSIAVAVAENLQYYLGKHGPLWLHVPLGVAIVVALVLQLVAVWRRPVASR